MDRLSAQDMMSLWPEELGWSQDIGALVILDGRPLLGPDGRFQIERVRDRIQERLHLVPRFRQRLYRPRFGLGWPLWVDAPAIDLTYHVQVLPLAASVDEVQLLLAVEELRQRRLDPRGRCGSCGSCPACQRDAWACSCGCTMRSPTAWPGSPRWAPSSIWTPTHLR
jgi:hypothetical protein